MSYQWEKAEAWRNHPLLRTTWRSTFPGLGTGVAVFALYVLWDKTMSTGVKKH